MPSTITAFITAIADTKARASHFNTNFSNFRGDIVPVTADTATASHRANNLGATDHYWNNLYGQIYNIGLTSTAITQLSALTAGGFQMFVNSVTAATFDVNGWNRNTSLQRGGQTTGNLFTGSTVISATTTGYTTTGLTVTVAVNSNTTVLIDFFHNYTTTAGNQLGFNPNAGSVVIGIFRGATRIQTFMPGNTTTSPMPFTSALIVDLPLTSGSVTYETRVIAANVANSSVTIVDTAMRATII